MNELEFMLSDFGTFEIMFLIVFTIILGMIIINMIHGIKQWNTNNHSPRLNVHAKVVSKRYNVSYYHDNDNITSSSTSYYVTFEVDSGDRLEFLVKGKEYGILCEGDLGTLSFQGTRYQGFERFV